MRKYSRSLQNVVWKLKFYMVVGAVDKTLLSHLANGHFVRYKIVPISLSGLNFFKLLKSFFKNTLLCFHSSQLLLLPFFNFSFFNFIMFWKKLKTHYHVITFGLSNALSLFGFCFSWPITGLWHDIIIIISHSLFLEKNLIG